MNSRISVAHFEVFVLLGFLVLDEVLLLFLVLLDSVLGVVPGRDVFFPRFFLDDFAQDVLRVH